MLNKGIRKGALVFLATVLISAGSISVYAADQGTQTETPIPTEAPVPSGTPEFPPPQPPVKPPEMKNGLKKEGKFYRFYVNGKLVKNKWKTIEGKKYFFKPDGNGAVYSNKIKGKYYVFNTKAQLLTPKKNSIIKVGTKKYYVNKKGNPIPGWHVINKKLYYVDKYGRCAANTKKGDITFTKDGCAKADVHAKLKMKCMEVLNRITKPSMSKSTKLRTCWYYLNGIKFHPWEFPDTTKKDWPQTCALELLNSMSGNCYGFANAFAVLAKELGYTPYVIEIPKCHCWVRIDGKYWDNMGNRMGTSTSRIPYRSDQIYKF